MTMYKNVNGVRVEMSEEEIASLNASQGTPVTAETIMGECCERLMQIFGARDPKHLERLTSEATAEAVNLLSRKEYWTEEEANRANELEAGYALLTAHDKASKALRAMDPIPKDYKDDKYWPSTS